MQDAQDDPTECTRRAMLSAMTIAAATAVGGCGGDAAERETLTMLVQSEPAHLDPRFPTDALSATLSRLVFGALVDIDPETLAYRPSLAQSIEQVDPLHIRAVLRSDARFHDGAPILASDVVATFEGLIEPRIGSPSRSIVSQTIASIRATSEREVEFTLREPTGIASLVLAQPIVRAADARKPELASEPGNERAFVGSGPMRVASLARNAWSFERVSPEPNKPRRVRFLTVKDANTMALRLLHGRADVAEVKPELFPLFIGREGFTVAHARGVAVAYLPLRNDHPRLALRQVRRALAHAIDRPALVRGKFAGYAAESTGVLPPWHWAYEGDVTRYSYDPARARAMLDAAWPEADRSRETLVFRCSNQRFVLTTAAAITEMLRAVGVRVELRPSELAVLLADLRAGRYDVALLQAPDVSEPHILWTLFASDARPTTANPRAGLNRWRFSNAAFDAAVNDGKRAAEREQRRRHYADAQRIFAEELPVIPLWHPDVVFVGSPRVAQLRSRGDARFDTLLDVRLREP
ncbi:MAG: ABC transporter substrate-binding protein [Polyangiales bacterium]